MHVLEHEHHGLGRALHDQEVLPRAPHLLGHQRGVRARRVEEGPDLALLRERGERHLPEERGGPQPLRAPHVPLHAREELLATGRRHVLGREARRRAHDAAHEREGRPGAERLPVRDPDLHLLVALAQAAEQLPPHARLAAARGAGDQREARHTLADALLVGPAEGGQLPLAPHAGRRLPSKSRGRSTGDRSPRRRSP